MPETYRTIEGDTIDAIAHRHYGRHFGTTEAIWRANRGLAKQLMILPEGLVLTLPDLDEAESLRTVKLYD